MLQKATRMLKETGWIRQFIEWGGEKRKGLGSALVWDWVCSGGVWTGVSLLRLLQVGVCGGWPVSRFVVGKFERYGAPPIDMRVAPATTSSGS